MEAYANVLLIAIPFFFVLIAIEAFYGWWKGELTFRSLDTISSLSSGITNTLKSILGLVVIIISYEWLVSKIAIFHIEKTWLVYVLSFIAIDFSSYWNHRLNHAINVFWNRHIVHHSSEEFNLACALRQSISVIWGFGALFLLPAALLGLPGEVVATLAPIHLFMQFWYHTKHIPKLGWLEYIIVTPSQHRVHHAINDIYLDKNLGAIFCIWDRLFGTFQEELDNVPCVYGVKKPPQTWNPIRINFQHLYLLTQDALRTNSWWDKIRLWFMPTGWRPADVAKRYPLQIITDPYTYEKYDTRLSAPLEAWSWLQFILANIFITHMLLQLAVIGFPALFYYGAFIFMLIYAYSALMDRDPNAIWFEAIKSIFGLGVLYFTGDWFELNQIFPLGNILIIGYLILSVLVVAYFVKTEISQEASLIIAKK